MEVKGCPFCGENEMIELRSRRCSARYMGWIVFVTCEMCGAQSKVFSCSEDPPESEWQNDACYKAIKAWNRRDKPHKR